MKVIEMPLEWAYDLTPRSITTQLILHHAAAEEATVEGIHSYHRNRGWAGIAYHYYVRKDGSVFRGRPESMRGGHTTNWNWCSIGICFEGNFEQGEMPQAQLCAGRELISDIMSRYPGVVVGRHCDFGQTACLGRNFPFDKLLEAGFTEPAGENAECDDLPDDWAAEGCKWAVERGIIKGDGSSCHWHSVITRQEAAVLLMRLFYYLSTAG